MIHRDRAFVDIDRDLDAVLAALRHSLSDPPAESVDRSVIGTLRPSATLPHGRRRRTRRCSS